MLIGSVVDATRRIAHCLFVVALHCCSCFCFRWVVANTCIFEEVCRLRDVSHGGGTVGVTLHVGFERDFLEGIA